MTKINSYQHHINPIFQSVITGILFLALLFCSLPLAVVTANAQTRGVGVRVTNEQTNKTEDVTLYKASYALIIGVSDYTNGWPDLPGVLDDIKAVEEALQGQGFGVTKVVNPTRDELRNGIESFIDKYGYDAGNRLLIYYAGHGDTGKTADGRKRGYIVPTDAPVRTVDNKGFQRTAVSMDQIELYARTIQAKHALFIFDSCFSGSLLNARRSGVPAIITYKATEPVRQFITAGTDEQEVPDKSIFREQFVAGLAGEGDQNKDGYITVTELASFLQDKVTNYTRGSQTPQYGKIFDGKLDKGDFIFISPKGTPTATTAVGQTAPVKTVGNAGERAFWESIKDSKDAEDFRFYLKSYPEGEFRPVAENSLRKLSKITTPAEPKNNPSTNTGNTNNSSPLTGLQREVGKYRYKNIDFESEVEVRIENGKLVMTTPGLPSVNLENVAGRKYKPLGQPDGNFITFKDTEALAQDHHFPSDYNYILPKLGIDQPALSSLQKETGRYRYNGIDIDIKIEGGKLVMSTPGQDPAVLENVAGRKYKPLNVPAGNFVTFKDTEALVENQEGGKFIISKSGVVQKNILGMAFAYIPPGTFQMGANNGEDDEKPVHEVKISKGYWIGQTEVTQEQWEKVMGSNPSENKNCGQCPVENVSWDDVQEFIKKLNEGVEAAIKQSNARANTGKYRLPTEAEWEYAARAGTTGDYAGNLDSMAWYYNNAGDRSLSGTWSGEKSEKNNNRTHPVGQRTANGWGLYDMHGNVWEWVEDWYGSYPTGSVIDPKGPTSGSARVNRGAGFSNPASSLQSAFRDKNSPGDRFSDMGFRLVRTLD